MHVHAPQAACEHVHVHVMLHAHAARVLLLDCKLMLLIGGSVCVVRPRPLRCFHCSKGALHVGPENTVTLLKTRGSPNNEGCMKTGLVCSHYRRQAEDSHGRSSTAAFAAAARSVVPRYIANV